MTRSVLAILVCVAASTVQLRAHPTAAASVTITVSAGETLVTVIGRAEAMALMLEALADTRLAPEGDAVARVEACAATLVRHAELLVNGARVPLAYVRAEPIADGSDRVAVYLHAATIGVETVAWRTALVVGAYPLIVQRGGPDTTAEADDTVPIAEWLNGPQVSRPVSLRDVDREGASAWSLIWIGVTHIVPKGLDHILFVLGLFLLARRTSELVAQITTFTVAHSVTLGLAAAGLVSLSPVIVEPLIALSIVYVAIENLVAAPLTRWRLGVVFVFGLLHGLGFAEALASLLPSSAALLPSLLAFNAGVEVGQLVVVAAAAGVIVLVRAAGADARALVTRPAAVVIAAMGLIWTVERVL